MTKERLEEYQIQIVLVKRQRSVGKDAFFFDEILMTDPVYTANVDDSGHAQAVVAAIEKYGRSL